MSYILEALKKSQAERQLGELPSIHAPQVQLHGGAAASGAQRGPVWLALAGILVAVAAALLWWQPWQAPAPSPSPVPAAALAAAAPPPASAPVSAPLPVAAPVAAAPAMPVPLPESKPVPKAQAQREAPPAPAVAAAPVMPVPAVAAPVPAADESVPGMRDLPEPIQRQIPPIALGGYIYSKNPADRLLLIDKVLRHEGEEVAPGLVLEKLQPKGASFSFKGYRYRVPY